VALTVIAPFDADIIVTLSPALRYDVPSVNCVNEPLRPELKLTAPVNVDPLTVATTESSMLIPYGLPAPPSAAIIPLVTNNDLFIECGIISKGNKVKTELTTC